MATTKPTFVAFCGAFHPHQAMEPLISKLKAAGYPTYSATLHTVGNARADVYDDVDQMRGMLSSLCDQGQDVVLVGTFVRRRAWWCRDRTPQQTGTGR
jgi:hypothetical protein